MIPKSNRKAELKQLPENYRNFFNSINSFVPQDRIITDHLRLLAFGTDASFYRLIPKIVVKVRSTDEVVKLIQAAQNCKTPVVFRAAGTSLSGQAVTDSVLVMLSGGWHSHDVLDKGQKIKLEPGVVGEEANAVLLPFQRKIGPDPASIKSCMIGGIAANNASGMCCGVDRNSYKTVKGMKLVLADGSLLDTYDHGSRKVFLKNHGALVKELLKIRAEIVSDTELAKKIHEKYRIKNTTGYSLNAFVDYSDPIDILMHLMIGSEGTLGFISEITYETVPEYPHKASSLIVFKTLNEACAAVSLLKSAPVTAVELMDRASLRSVQHKQSMPSFLKDLDAEAAALLVESGAYDKDELDKNISIVLNSIEKVSTVFPPLFTFEKNECDKLWDVRRGLFPSIGGNRNAGTTVIIEDVVFPVEKLANAASDLRRSLKKYGYDEAIIFGHALDGNLHFVFTQDFSLPGEVERYRKLMDDVAEIVVKRYSGSLKGEHGTGRNMAPFVEMEWGKKAFELMKRIKNAFDPCGILNPGVILNSDNKSHIHDLKPLPRVNEKLDPCMECGFCEVKCPSKNITLTPRQRIVVQREISRLKNSSGDQNVLSRLEADYTYWGQETCAADGLCSTACPVEINVGEFTKCQRSDQNSWISEMIARFISANFAWTVMGLRFVLSGIHIKKVIFSEWFIRSVSVFMHKTMGLPLWNRKMPRAGYLGGLISKTNQKMAGFSKKVVYFPSCIARSMGPSEGDEEKRSVVEVMLSVLNKAGWEAVFPENVDQLCCGHPFESKGFFDEADRKVHELCDALTKVSENGKYPVVCDTSPCLYRMREKLGKKLKLYEPVEFIHDFLLSELKLEKLNEKIAIHLTCSSERMGLNGKLYNLASACAKEVVIPKRVNCCGFAGDRGFTHPELNESALSALKEQVCDCSAGYSNSRACEIGLSLHGGIEYRSLVYLVDRCSKRRI